MEISSWFRMLFAQVEREIEGIDNLRVDWEVRHLRQRKWDELGLFLILVFLFFVYFVLFCFILFILFAVGSNHVAPKTFIPLCRPEQANWQVTSSNDHCISAIESLLRPSFSYRYIDVIL